MRSFPIHLANPATRLALLAPCLLICLACATPFPVQSLEEGMTTETVRENFGEPRAMETRLGGLKSSWTYAHEKQVWLHTVMASTFFLPHCALITAATMPFGEEYWCSAVMPTVEKGQVTLHFEAAKLVRWEAYTNKGSWRPDVAAGARLLEEMGRKAESDKWFRQRMKDIEHHKKGHTQHHGH